MKHKKTVYTGAEIILESLLRNGVEVVFGFPGGTVIPLYDELLRYSDRLRHVLVRHEQGAVHAAQGYARTRGRPGVAIGTSGPGAANLITGIMDAHLDSTPLVVLGGQVATPLIGTDAFQECDMMGMANPITKHNFQVHHADDLAKVMDQAFHIATTGRPGPVYIDLPKDVQVMTSENVHNGPLDLPYYVESRPADPEQIEDAAELIRGAERPILILGQGAILSGATDKIRAMIEDLQLPVTTTILGKGSVDEDHPLSLGCMGMHGRRVANFAVVHCDVMIALGCRFSDRITGEPHSFAAGKKIVHVDIDLYELDKNVPSLVGLNCDAKEAVEKLHAALHGFEGAWRGAWNDRIQRYRKICHTCIVDPVQPELYPKRVVEVLNGFIKDDDIVTTGVGQHQMFASHYLTRSKPGTFITSGGAGTMGFGLPSGIGAAIGSPDKRTFVVDGDGSFQMTLQELGTLAETRAPVTVVIIDNGYLGMVRQWQELFYDKRYSAVDMGPTPDFVKIASAYGIEGSFVSDEEGLREALTAAAACEGGYVIHVAVEKESNMIPMVPPGGKLSEFMGYCVAKTDTFFAEDEDSASDESRG